MAHGLFLAWVQDCNCKYFLGQLIMQNKQLLWLGSLVTVGIMATSPAVVAQTNLSDVSGGQTFSAPAIGIDGTNNNGFFNPVSFDPVTITFSGGPLGEPISIESFSPNAGASIGIEGSSSPSGSIGSVDCSGKDCIGSGKPQKVSLDQVAEILGDNLEQSLDTLAAMENEASVADTGPRRIVRSSSLNTTPACGCDPSEPRRISRNPEIEVAGCCDNPDFKNRELEARRIVNQQLEEAKKFIEQVEQIKPEKYIW